MYSGALINQHMLLAEGFLPVTERISVGRKTTWKNGGLLQVEVETSTMT